MPPPPDLMDELVEEVLLRLPLDSPAHLAGAALVCRRWWRLVSGAAFRRRLRDLHRESPMLGFLCNLRDACLTHLARFVPTTTSTFSPRAGDHPWGWRADDARHGRVLLSRHHVLMVWDPITDHFQELPVLPWPVYSYRAAILCAADAACDHLDCHRGGPFLVVYIGVGHVGAFSCVYSSDAAAWSKPASVQFRLVDCLNFVQSVLVGKALYFMFHRNNEVLEFDLKLCQVVSVIKLPPYTHWLRALLTTTEDGGLGFAAAIEHKLCLWSRKDGSKGDDATGWI
ncbi:hypothetical protein HU200_000465 [Digitaria exilis]|uniref:F-box domain-containing protein n=1 Tax=Digitaria exilis TaxID=1010633 RepID=A0A835G0E0_9POAL|nr:hypothetical protein HU200_000465 [Digitaria exilis]